MVVMLSFWANILDIIEFIYIYIYIKNLIKNYGLKSQYKIAPTLQCHFFNLGSFCIFLGKIQGMSEHMICSHHLLGSKSYLQFKT